MQVGNKNIEAPAEPARAEGWVGHEKRGAARSAGDRSTVAMPAGKLAGDMALQEEQQLVSAQTRCAEPSSSVRH